MDKFKYPTLSTLVKSSMDETFETDVKSIDIYSEDVALPEGWDWDHNQSVKLKWGVSIDLRPWGIQSFNISVPDQKIQVKYVNSDNPMDEKFMELEIKNAQIDFNQNMESNNFSFAPYSITLQRNRWQVDF